MAKRSGGITVPKPISQRRNLIVSAVVAVVTLALVGGGVAYDRHRSSNPPAATASSGASNSAAQFRIQPDAYYDDPWVYFIGDSYTEGTEYDSGPAAVWTTLVSNERGWYQRNFGVGGSGYATNGNNGKSYLGQVEGSRLIDANAIVVSGGVNDVRGAATLDEIVPRISETMTRIRSFAPQTPLTVVSVFDPYVDVSPKIDAMNAALRTEAQRVGATFVWATGLLRGDPRVVAQDQLHPNDAGHAEIAAAIGPQLAEPTPRAATN